MIESDRAEVYRYDGDIAFPILITDHIVHLALSKDSVGGMAWISTTDEVVRDWAEATFEEHRDEAVRLTGETKRPVHRRRGCVRLRDKISAVYRSQPLSTYPPSVRINVTDTEDIFSGAVPLAGSRTTSLSSPRLGLVSGSKPEPSEEEQERRGSDEHTDA